MFCISGKSARESGCAGTAGSAGLIALDIDVCTCPPVDPLMTCPTFLDFYEKDLIILLQVSELFSNSPVHL